MTWEELYRHLTSDPPGGHGQPEPDPQEAWEDLVRSHYRLHAKGDAGHRHAFRPDQN